MSLSALAELSRGSKAVWISNCRGGESPNYIRVDAGTVRCVLCIAVVDALTKRSLLVSYSVTQGAVTVTRPGRFPRSQDL